MRHVYPRAAAFLAAIALTAAVAVAADGKPASVQAAPKAGPADKAAAPAASKPAPKKLVDLNRANKAELMKLPGVDEALAAKMIAGRPYLSKADLVTHAVLPRGVYEGLKADVVAKPK